MTDTSLVTPPALTRSPLSNRANIYVDTATTSWEHKDSSEGQPSTHGSVCDAAWVSTSDLAKSPYQTPGRPVTPLRSIEIDLDSESPLSRLETPFLYGYGTELAPILEQRSIGTLRTKGSRSTSDLSSLLHDAPGADTSGRSHSKSDGTIRHLHRQRSFSLDEIPPNPSSPHAQQETASPSPQLKWLSYSRPTVHVVDVHVYPRKPIYPPPQRPLTPPSLRRIRRPQSEGDAYVASTSSGVAYAAPGFRPPRSGHGNLSAHPFMSQPQPQPPTTATDGTRASARAPPLGGLRDASTTTRAVPNGHVAHTSQHDSSIGSNPDIGYLAPLEIRGGTCKKCRHPRGERWSLGSTLIGHGPGVRRGADWCSRCACRKVIRAWCCGEMGH
ncbi:hypothetical protein E0Z10_g5692 [Xylaria hypoxylon]|uniref:Uncharacterized protein n=1 Tax=Xylaria hypoxylon TaxID=37992 RepID=A0A4Z0YX98_9PEZI|nr:hypothetical protein E0Z10_g5692 [Xylaria hypoxylon]